MALFGSVNTRDFFWKIDKKRLKRAWRNSGVKHTALSFCREVFDNMIELILLEVIEKNVIFALPKYYGYDLEFCIETVTGDELKRCMQNGEFADVDIIQSGFKAHRVKLLVSKPEGEVWDHLIWLKNPELIKKLTDNTNKGNVYY